MNQQNDKILCFFFHRFTELNKKTVIRYVIVIVQWQELMIHNSIYRFTKKVYCRIKKSNKTLQQKLSVRTMEEIIIMNSGLSTHTNSFKEKRMKCNSIRRALIIFVDINIYPLKKLPFSSFIHGCFCSTCHIRFIWKNGLKEMELMH